MFQNSKGIVISSSDLDMAIGKAYREVISVNQFSIDPSLRVITRTDDLRSFKTPS